MNVCAKKYAYFLYVILELGLFVCMLIFNLHMTLFLLHDLAFLS